MTGFEIADLVVFLVWLIFVSVSLFFTVKNKGVLISLITCLCLLPVFYFLDMMLCFYTSLALLLIICVLYFYMNLATLRSYLIKQQKSSKKNKPDKALTQASFDREKVNDIINDAVMWLSHSKTGAIITFERNSSLDSFIKTGTVINSPLSAELIETIFYEGTRLHDGALVIRGDKMVAASVFFTATSRPLVGKYGARHRAALGISEQTDSLTIVVSEETGRISIAYGGSLESVKTDEFKKVFSTYKIGKDEDNII